MLAPGHKLGHYEIQAMLGSGGMGEVYRARDTRLERIVAIKILPAQFSDDPARKQRFEREAKTISNLNHPNICVLYDVGHQDGMDYLVMECVQGETLADRLERGPLPLEQVLKRGCEIAEALNKAHRSGIVHRDLKPGNIMLTPAGAKLLDFGLAKPAALATLATMAVSAEAARPVTQEGAIVGTFQYMSPEQIEGKDVDGRSDIFSLGAVLYEMLTGQRAFSGKSQISVASAILEKEPAPIASIKPMTPPALDHAIRRCLAKDPEERWQTARDLAEELRWIANQGNAAGAQAPLISGGFKQSRLLWALSLGLIGLAAIAIWGWMRSSPPARRPVMRWVNVFPPGYTIANVTLSPDGSHIAYMGRASGMLSNWHLYVRPTDELQARIVSGDDLINAPGTFLFAPDGSWIAYFSQGKLKKVPVAGGAAITICDSGSSVSGAWGSDDTIVLGARLGQVSGLSRVPASGGKLETLTVPDPQKGETDHSWPFFLPDGKNILFSIASGGSWDDARIAVLNLRTGKIRVLLEGGWSPRYVPTGHLVFTRRGSLFAVPFDAGSLQVKGTPSAVLEGVYSSAARGFPNYSFSNSGELVYSPNSAEEKTTMAWVDRTGKVEPLQAPARTYASPSLSPDGRSIAVSIEAGSADNWDIWVYDIGRRTLTKLTYGLTNLSPVWTPDGKRVAFRRLGESGKAGMFWAPADGSGPPQQLFASEHPVVPGSWLPDVSGMVFYEVAQRGAEIRLLQVKGEGAAGAGHGIEIERANAPQLSPDGKWIAYNSSESGVSQVYVQPFPSLVGKWQVSTDGGGLPRWARSGRELFYRNAGKMMAVEIETTGGFRAGAPKMLFEGNFAGSPLGFAPSWGFDVSADGKRFLMIKPDSDSNAAMQIDVVENWFDELRRRVPAESRSDVEFRR